MSTDYQTTGDKLKNRMGIIANRVTLFCSSDLVVTSGLRKQILKSADEHILQGMKQLQPHTIWSNYYTTPLFARGQLVLSAV